MKISPLLDKVNSPELQRSYAWNRDRVPHIEKLSTGALEYALADTLAGELDVILGEAWQSPANSYSDTLND